MPMLERIAGNRELKQDLKTALGSGRIAHSIINKQHTALCT